ncbi:hypothetical protein SBA5_110109 [Candidatus Sulfotelmatomonas gaucii]|uniref:Uncharacterized protein n=1 Tax=Candidatus Sulfuritelmatomonas gaucii TaxID=2043161 RepID=A0A2N9L3D7_9BACT|nr:hypothetical protein SBA5_110109 [Candidatus Sulfotelmatomonas gaucii]
MAAEGGAMQMINVLLLSGGSVACGSQATALRYASISG